MTGYLVQDGSSYLEWIPAQKRYGWLAAFPEHASVLTRSEAIALSGRLGGQVVPDPLARELPAIAHTQAS